MRAVDTISRRHAIAGVVAGAIGFAAGSESARAFAGHSLADHAAAKGILFGSAIGPTIETDAGLRDLVLSQCSIVVPEYELKWDHISSADRQYDFSVPDRRLDFARANGLKFRGHALVWPGRLPDWMPHVDDRHVVDLMLKNHVGALVGRYRDQFHSWDVINEGIDLTEKGVDGLTPCLFQRVLGRDYIDIAFRVAHEIDPRVILVYNENGIEYATEASARKRAAVLKLVRGLLDRKVPIHAIGIQMHVATDGPESFDPKGMDVFIRAVARLGLQVFITELDVSDQFAAGDVEVRDARVADVYATVLETVLAVPATTMVVTWGLSDRLTWLSQMRPRGDGLHTRPLPYDISLGPKPCRQAIVDAFDRTFRRPSAR